MKGSMNISEIKTSYGYLLEKKTFKHVVNNTYSSESILDFSRCFVNEYTHMEHLKLIMREIQHYVKYCTKILSISTGTLITRS